MGELRRVLTVEELLVEPPRRGANEIRCTVRNRSPRAQTCMVAVEITGHLWFRSMTQAVERNRRILGEVFGKTLEEVERDWLKGISSCSR